MIQVEFLIKYSEIIIWLNWTEIHIEIMKVLSIKPRKSMTNNWMEHDLFWLGWNVRIHLHSIRSYCIGYSQRLFINWLTLEWTAFVLYRLHCTNTASRFCTLQNCTACNACKKTLLVLPFQLPSLEVITNWHKNKV